MKWFALFVVSGYFVRAQSLQADPIGCVTSEKTYNLGETWNPDECTTCTCSGNPLLLSCSFICREAEPLLPPPHDKSCDSNPCQNNGTCKGNRDGSYVCVCRHHYSGFNCEKEGDQEESLTPVQMMEGGLCEKPAIIKIWSRVIHNTADSRHPKMRCQATGHPTPFISWSPVKDKTRFIIDRQGTLSIRNPTSRDSGIYTCTVSNECGQASSKTEVVIRGDAIEDAEKPTAQAPVTDRPCESPTITKFSSRLVHAIGSRHPRIRCKAAGHPNPAIFWSPIKDKGRFIINKLGTLTIRNPRPEDAGVYICNVSNKCGQSSIATEFIVEYREKSTTPVSGLRRPCERPVITKFSSHVIHEIGSRHPRLICKVTGRPNLTISWSPIKDKRRFIINSLGTLIIRNASAADAGMYTCSALNECGQASIQTKFITADDNHGESITSLPVTDKPCEKPTIANVSFHVIHKTKLLHAELRCNVTGYPVPKVIWSPVKDEKRFAVDNLGTMTIKTPRAEDAGVYTCTASNKCGQDSSKVNVIMDKGH